MQFSIQEGTAEDKMQFAVGMYHLLHRPLSLVLQVQDILGNAFEEEQSI
jgi:hypothetical protein